MDRVSIKPITEENEVIPPQNLNPSWTDRDFKKPQTVFLDTEFTTEKRFSSEIVKKAEYVYSDRLVQWHGDKCGAAKDKAKINTNPYSPNFFEAYLQILMNKPNLRLVHIISGVNVGNGYPYRVYGFIEE